MQFSVKDPLYKTNQFLLFTILVVIVLYYGSTFLIPIVFGALLAMLMAPVCRKLDHRGWRRAASVSASVLILMVALLSMLAIIVAQISSFRQDLPQIQDKLGELIADIQSFIYRKISIPPDEQTAMVKEQVQQFGKSAGDFIGKILESVTAVIGAIALTLVYTFLFLYNKEKWENFFLKLNKDEDPKKITEVISKIAHVSQQYLSGRAKSMLILAILYAIGLLIIGIKNALLLAAIASLLTIIPYIGPFLGGLIPVTMALFTEDTFEPALWVTALLFVVQAIDNYFVEPNVLGGEVHLSPLATIMIIVAGGLIWGVAGMILFIPMLSIAKIIFDHVEQLRPYGYVLGDQSKTDPSKKVTAWVKKLFSGKRKA